MADFLLVHGACHGAWCWRDLIPALAARGHEARAIDLPGHGDDIAPPEQVTLADYRRAVGAALGRDTVLVGHSMGGLSVSAAAEDAPDRIARLVYLCAMIPRDGMSIGDVRREMGHKPLAGAAIPSEDGKTFTVDPARGREIFLHDAPEGLADYVMPRLSPEPVAPQLERLTLGAEFDAVPRSAILCAQDRVIRFEDQQMMARAAGIKDIHEMQTGHSPFFADPEGLAALLDRIAS
jgi:pimeloyl-ACP methyl ester carboxylesterase